MTISKLIRHLTFHLKAEGDLEVKYDDGGLPRCTQPVEGVQVCGAGDRPDKILVLRDRRQPGQLLHSEIQDAFRKIRGVSKELHEGVETP